MFTKGFFVQLKTHPDYLVTDLGEIFSFKTGKWRQLKCTTDKKGYKHFRLFKQAKAKDVKVHRMVCEVFYGKSHLQVNHKDGRKDNNCIDNLEYCTNLENAQHAMKSELWEPIRRAACKLTDEQVIQIRSLKGQMSQKEVGKMFGATQQHVGCLWRGEYRSKGAVTFTLEY